MVLRSSIYTGYDFQEYSESDILQRKIATRLKDLHISEIISTMRHLDKTVFHLLPHSPIFAILF